MTDPYTVILCCERVEDAVSEGDPSALRHRLRELADVLASDHLDDPVYEELESDVTEIAALATDREAVGVKLTTDESGIPEELAQEVNALTHRVARCYLRSVSSESDTTIESSAGERSVTHETRASEKQADEGTESTSWMSRANALTDEQSSATASSGESDEMNDGDHSKQVEKDAVQDSPSSPSTDRQLTICDNCGHQGSSLRPGDICPECKRGYVEPIKPLDRTEINISNSVNVQVDSDNSINENRKS